MRFLFLTQYFPPEVGAAQVRLGALAEELLRKGHQVEIVTAMPNHPGNSIQANYRGKFYVHETWKEIPVHRLWLYVAQGAGMKRLLNYISFMFSCLLGLARAKKPDYIFVESPPLFLGLPGLLAGWRFACPVIFNVADLWPDSVKELGLMKAGLAFHLATKLEAWIYKKSGFLNAVTDGIERSLVERKHISKNKILFLPNGVDTKVFQPTLPDQTLLKELNLEGKQLLLYAGTHGYAHGLEVALQAMNILKNTNIILLLIGDGSEKTKLMQIAQDMQLKNVRFLNAAPPEYVARLYSLSFAGLSTLRNLDFFEGTRPAKIFGAMSSGKPVVYSGKGEGARLLEKAHAGVVVEPENAKALAEAIETLSSNTELARAIGNNGRKHIEQFYSWVSITETWLQQLQERGGHAA